MTFIGMVALPRRQAGLPVVDIAAWAGRAIVAVRWPVLMKMI
jgi:hypothetical protein